MDGGDSIQIWQIVLSFFVVILVLDVFGALANKIGLLNWDDQKDSMDAQAIYAKLICDMFVCLSVL